MTDNTIDINISQHDPNSYANNLHVKLNHFDWNVKVDFSIHVLSGHVLLDFSMLQASRFVVLDTHHLNITNVQDQNKQPLKFAWGKYHEAFGTPLQIELPSSFQSVGSTFQIRIDYSTSPQAGAIQFLPPSQTKGGKYPYLFTQCQAIHARSLVPIFDSPSNKCPYSASVSVPSPLTALMSAKSIQHTTDGEYTIFTFKQPVPIPSYLLALAVGNLTSRQIGPRSHVWSEAEMVDAGAFEFDETEKFIAAGEAICGPYVWGHYDILLLPPSFPYGGMENPCLTFVTPTLLAGDRSLATVVAHEIAHSWFGNEITSFTWEHFWMNEGFTVFLERKIVKALFGAAQADLQAIIGYQDLCKCCDRIGREHPYTCLHVKLNGVDPDDAFSSVPYEKGFNFLVYLEKLVGGEQVMNPFLKAHCQRYHHSTVNCVEWKEFFLSYFADKVPADKLASIDWDLYLEKPGIGWIKNEFDTSLIVEAQNLATNIIQHKQAAHAQAISKFSSSQIVIFLEKVLDFQSEASDKKAFGARLLELDEVFHFTASKNSEVRFRWLTLCIRSQLTERYDAIAAFITEQGRMKFIRPLYRDLYQQGGEVGKKFAVQTFNKHKEMYHSIAAKMVAKDLELS